MNDTPALLLYTRPDCMWCLAIKQLLASRGLKWQERVVNDEDGAREMMEATGRRSVPQLVAHGKALGGYQEVKALADAGTLADALGNAGSV
ncbi:MAG: glutaredoxin domain-containing protein [Xanthomonadales bacterium]|nr:glutaredoxin domain-containing protein [Xanthomonadales bacterium]